MLVVRSRSNHKLQTQLIHLWAFSSRSEEFTVEGLVHSRWGDLTGGLTVLPSTSDPVCLRPTVSVTPNLSASRSAIRTQVLTLYSGTANPLSDPKAWVFLHICEAFLQTLVLGTSETGKGQQSPYGFALAEFGLFPSTHPVIWEPVVAGHLHLILVQHFISSPIKPSPPCPPYQPTNQPKSSPATHTKPGSRHAQPQHAVSISSLTSNPPRTSSMSALDRAQ